MNNDKSQKSRETLNITALYYDERLPDMGNAFNTKVMVIEIIKVLQCDMWENDGPALNS